jgi:hypothetical protein
MQNLRLFSVLLIIFSLFGCGKTETAENPKAESGEKISMKFQGREVSFEPSYARFATFKKGLVQKVSDIQNKDEQVEAVVHRIYLANYDLQLTDPAKQDYRRISADRQYRVEIQIEAEENSPENAQLKPGEYSYKKEPFNRVSWVFLSYFKDGNDRNENLQASEFAGKVKITSISDAEIKGEIDVFDKNEFVKGNFTARKLGQ